jgi:hypothetical protein
LQDWLMGPDWVAKNKAQIEANAKAHSFAAGTGAMVGQIPGFFGPGGVARKLESEAANLVSEINLARKLNMFERAGALEGELAAKQAALKSLPTELAGSAEAGARFVGSEAAQKQFVEGEPEAQTWGNIPEAIAKGALTMGPLGFISKIPGLGEAANGIVAKTLQAGGHAATAAEILAHANAIYDSVVSGKPYSELEVQTKAAEDIPAFLALGGLTAGAGKVASKLRERAAEKARDEEIRAQVAQREKEGAYSEYDKQNREANMAAAVTEQPTQPRNVSLPEGGQAPGETGALVQKPSTLTYSAEMTPGSTSGLLPELAKADLPTREEFHRDMQDALSDPKTGEDLIAKALGVPVQTKQQFTAPSLYRNPAGEWERNPATQVQIPREMADAYALLHGIYTKQNAVAGYLPEYGTGKTTEENGVRFVMDRPATDEELGRIKDSLVQQMGDDRAGSVGFFNRPDGFHIVNFGGGDNVNTRNEILRAVDSAKVPVKDSVNFKSDGIYHENDWRTNPSFPNRSAAPDDPVYSQGLTLFSNPGFKPSPNAGGSVSVPVPPEPKEVVPPPSTRAAPLLHPQRNRFRRARGQSLL